MTVTARMKRIIAATDLSRPSLVGIEQALRIARLTGAEVYVVHAGGIPDEDGTADSSERFARIVDALSITSRAEFQAVLDRYPDITIQRMAINPSVKRGIPDFAAELHADLIVVGTHGHTGFRRFFLGSVAEKIVRLSKTNVMVARDDHRARSSFHRILVPTDFSAPARNGLHLAVTLADVDTQIDLLHCWHVPYVSTGEWGPGMLSSHEGPLREHLRQNAITMGEKAIAPYRKAMGSRLSFVEIEGHPDHTIIEELETHRHDLVVVGSHGKRGLQRLALGSTAERTVRYAPCSTIVVHNN